MGVVSSGEARRCAVTLSLLAAIAGLAASVEGRAILPPLDASVRSQVERATALVLVPGGSGSGFVVGSVGDALLLLTNAHVLQSQGVRLSRVRVAFDAGSAAESEIDAEVLATDPDGDLALLSAAAARPGRSPLPIARTCGNDTAGVTIHVAGFPLGTDLSFGASGPNLNIGSGSVDAGEDARGLLALDVGITPGNSGGPVVDSAGTVLGVAVSHLRGTDQSFAVGCSAIQRFVKQAAPHVGLSLRAPVAGQASRQLGAEQVDPEFRRAMAALRTSSGRGTGFVAGRLGDESMIVTADVGMFRWATGEVLVTLGGERRARTGRILLLNPSVAVVAVPSEQERVRALAVDSRWPQATEPVRILGFEPKAAEQDFALLWEAGNVTSVRTADGGALAGLQVDFGVDGGLLGGPVFGTSGGVVAVARARGPGTSVRLAVPADAVQDLLAHACRDRSRELVRLGAATSTGGGQSPTFQRAAAVVGGGRGGRSHEAARRALQESCDRERGSSCWELSLFVRKGLGVERDEDLARNLLRRACALGERQGCLDLLAVFDDC